MVKINKIYTRTGDDGTTGLVGGTRIKKNSSKVQAYGDVDELNSWIGLIRTALLTGGSEGVLEQLATIQNILFDIGAVLAAPPDLSWPSKRTIGSAEISVMEGWIDLLSSRVPELRSFVLPGGTLPNSFIHIARTVCRRAERSILTLSEDEVVSSGIIQFINRLSDYLFALARSEISHAGGTEFLWNPGEDSPL